MRRSLAHHLELVDAVRAADPVWAGAVMTAHIHNARSVMVRAAREENHDLSDPRDSHDPPDQEDRT